MNVEYFSPSGLPNYDYKRVIGETHWRAPMHGTKGSPGELMQVIFMSCLGGAGALQRNLCKL